MSTIFVNGFEYGTDEEAVMKHFSTVGAIKELHFQSRGAAVITYEKASAASKAISDLHETTMEGQSRYVAVKMDDRKDKTAEGKGSGKVSGKSWKEASGKGGAASGRSIFVTGFDFDSDDAVLYTHFGTVGAIETLHFQSKWSAVITFVKASTAQKAATELDGTTMSGQSRYVAVRLDDPDRSGSKGEGKGKGKGKASDKGKGKGGKGDKGKGKGKSKASGKNGGKDSSGRAIYVSGFDFGTTTETLEEHFCEAGAIDTLYFQSKGAAVITFVKAAAAQRALAELDRTTMNGQSRYVALKLDNAEHGNGSY